MLKVLFANWVRLCNSLSMEYQVSRSNYQGPREWNMNSAPFSAIAHFQNLSESNNWKRFAFTAVLNQELTTKHSQRQQTFNWFKQQWTIILAKLRSTILEVCEHNRWHQFRKYRTWWTVDPTGLWHMSHGPEKQWLYLQTSFRSRWYLKQSKVIWVVSFSNLTLCDFCLWGYLL